MISEERYKFIVTHARGMALDVIWLYLEDDSCSYSDRQNKFLWILKRMLDARIISLAKNGSILDKPADAIINDFKKSFPEQDEDVNNGMWFFLDSCPTGIGWNMPDGSIDWA
ncbi:DUF596 domain-containing protein [Microvirgula sp. AG722]|uniref:DUF596 domain-containing protein n=1 Tax=Microvirgula sp. AG722 TaxID=2183901 RepID=UPI000DD8290C|nr:DUF596 domain-containing protein [Microvirgula sp. AG722]